MVRQDRSRWDRGPEKKAAAPEPEAAPEAPGEGRLSAQAEGLRDAYLEHSGRIDELFVELREEFELREAAGRGLMGLAPREFKALHDEMIPIFHRRGAAAAGVLERLMPLHEWGSGAKPLREPESAAMRAVNAAIERWKAGEAA